ncbi:Dynactin subunit 6 [Cytospora mali]|uniref:Dynactin subunit 6 n=1 Tax=Cytospora mali TaxID=578113 RepID=A0A194VYH4_CYTMA|nr:Dynactin subunit 6 [Valsa mali]
MSSHHKRHSILPPVIQAGPKAPVRFSSTLTIAESAVLSGSHTIQIRSESVVHPRAKIESLVGPIDIGRRCIVHERTHIGAPGDRGKISAEGTNAVTILDYCTVEVAATVEAGGTVIGEGTVVGVGSRVGSGAVIGKYCTLSPRSIILPGETVPDYTIIFANGTHRRDKRDVIDIRTRTQVRQLDILRKLIPSKPSKFE